MSEKISGNISEIPVLIERKKANIRKQVKNVLHVGFISKNVGNGDCYDIVIENNERYLLGDFTVVS